MSRRGILTLAFAAFLIVSASQVCAQTSNKPPAKAYDDPFLKASLLKAANIPKNVWGRIKKAEEWVWNEYPDEVLIQEAARIKWKRYLAAAINVPDWLDVAGAFRVRRESFDHAFRADEENSTSQWAQRARFRIAARWRRFRAQIEFQGSSSGEDVQTDIGTSTFNAANVQQLFLSVSLPYVSDTMTRADVHVGRINLDIGSRRLIARSRFGNTTQSFDGIHVNLANQDAWHFRAFFTEAIVGTEAIDRLALFTNSDVLFWGLSYENHQLPWSRVHLYYVGTNAEETDDLKARTHSTFGLRFYMPPKNGDFDFDGESLWQKGKFDHRDHFAHFQHVSVGYTFDVPWSPRILAMYDYASGTSNPNGTKSHTFDGLFGSRRFEFSPTSLFGPFFRSNISSPGIRLILKPHPLTRINFKFRAWYLAKAKDQWVNSGLQDSTGNSGRILGQDIEVRVQWNPYPNLSFDAGYDHFFKGSYIKDQANVPGNPSKKDTNYFYFQTEVKF